MAIHQKLHARLVQKLILTPSLQQAIKLLPMSAPTRCETVCDQSTKSRLILVNGGGPQHQYEKAAGMVRGSDHVTDHSHTVDTRAAGQS